MQPLIAFVDVTKRYGDKSALAGVSFSVEKGETLGLVGVNGAGKTTLIRGLLDLNRIDGGHINLDGVRHTEVRARACLSYLGERFSPPRFATGDEFLRHAMALHRRRFEPAAAAREAQALDLDPAALARPVREYSKGMAQKLGLIATLLPGTPLLVLDEPMSGLDPRARALVKARLGSLRAAGTTLFFSTHLLADVESLCDRIVLLEAGRVRFAGTPAALLERFAAPSLEAAFLAAVGTTGSARA